MTVITIKSPILYKHTLHNYRTTKISKMDHKPKDIKIEQKMGYLDKGHEDQFWNETL